MNICRGLFLLPLGLIFSLLSYTAVDQKGISIKDNSASIEGIATLTPKNQSSRFGGGLYGRPAPRGSSQSSSDSILVVLKSTDSNNSLGDTPHFLNQKDRKFVPTVLPIPMGGTVRIQNSDPVYHNVFSLTSPHKFDVGRRPKGEYFDVVFEKPGVVDVFCDIHSNMRAVIYVLPPNTSAWTKIKSGATFSFENISEGSYVLTFYALGYQEMTTSISVSNGEIYQAGAITLNP